MRVAAERTDPLGEPDQTEAAAPVAGRRSGAVEPAVQDRHPQRVALPAEVADDPDSVAGVPHHMSETAPHDPVGGPPHLVGQAVGETTGSGSRTALWWPGPATR